GPHQDRARAEGGGREARGAESRDPEGRAPESRAAEAVTPSGPRLAVLLLLAASGSAGGDEWTAPEAERARPNPVATTPAALQKGRALYQKHCASCHGDKGLGDGA